MGKNKRQNPKKSFRIPINKAQAARSVFKVIILLSLAAGLIYFLRYTMDNFAASDTFRIKRILSNEKLDHDLKVSLVGRQLFNLNTAKVHSTIQVQHPEFKEILVSKEFPDAIKIVVTKRIPLVQLVQDGYYPVDKEGVVISDVQPTPLAGLVPVEIGELDLPLQRGSKLFDSRFFLSLSLIKVWSSSNFYKKFPLQLISTVNVDALYFVISGVRIIIGKDEFERKIRILDTILKEDIKDNLSSLEYIDLRYQKVYLGYKR